MIDKFLGGLVIKHLCLMSVVRITDILIFRQSPIYFNIFEKTCCPSIIWSLNCLRLKLIYWLLIDLISHVTSFQPQFLANLNHDLFLIMTNFGNFSNCFFPRSNSMYSETSTVCFLYIFIFLVILEIL